MLTFLSHIASNMLFLLICGTILVIMGSNSDSSKKIAWILIVALLPAVGVVLYVVFGLETRKPDYFLKNHRTFLETFERYADDSTKLLLFGKHTQDKIRPGYRELSRLLSCCNGTTVCEDNNIEIITSGKRKFEALVEDIKNARHHIHMEYFYFRKDDGSKEIKKLLMQKAREGVKVRFIHENIANIAIDPHYYNEMKDAGVEVVKFTNPKFSLFKLNYRDHRKIVVIDGDIGYTGGMNISDDYFIRWRDTHIRLTGNAVSSLQYSFMNSFITSGGRIDEDFAPYYPEHEAFEENDRLVQIVPDEPDSQWPILLMGTTWTVQHTKDYIYIQTPYFVPPESLLQALKTSALKGADVRIMIPQKADLFFMGPVNKAYYKECLEAGVKIYEKTGRFIHSKTLVSDDYVSIVGTANMDYRSLELNYEINSYIYDENMARMNREIFLNDMKECHQITLDEWNRRPWYHKALQVTLKLFSPLL